MANIHYKARKGSRFSDQDAQVIGDFLRRTFPDGKFSTKDVLRAAKPKHSPIHKYFTWNKSRAAEKYWLYQAANLVNSIIITVEDSPVRAYTPPVMITVSDSHKEREFVRLDVAREDEDIWTQVLKRALSEAESWKSRYQHLKELKPVFKSIDQIKRKFKFGDN